MPKNNEIGATIIPFGTARIRFDTIIRRTKENGERYIVDRRGEPQAVILLVDDDLNHVPKRSKSLAALRRVEAGARRVDHRRCPRRDAEDSQVRGS